MLPMARSASGRPIYRLARVRTKPIVPEPFLVQEKSVARTFRRLARSRLQKLEKPVVPECFQDPYPQMAFFSPLSGFDRIRPSTSVRSFLLARDSISRLFRLTNKPPLPIRPAATASQRAPLRRCAVRQIRDFSRGTPSFHHASGDTFPSDCRAALILFVARASPSFQKRLGWPSALGTGLQRAVAGRAGGGACAGGRNAWVTEIRGAAPVNYEQIPLPPQFRRFLIACAIIKVNPPREARHLRRDPGR
jgi:hypothetical protein